jgi:SAM-dependent methyltransferase
VTTQRYLDAARTARQRWDARYAEGETPWDTQITPPEVVAFWQSGRLRPQGVALDMGCGPGTNVRYLARLGLTAVGVEIAAAPLRVAQRRLAGETPAPRGHAAFVCADVCALPFHGLGARYVLDIGCLHSLPPEHRRWYARDLVANLAPGGYYQVYAFDDTSDGQNAPPRGPRGMAPGEVARLFTPAFDLLEEVAARPDRRPCRWYLLRKP